MGYDNSGDDDSEDEEDRDDQYTESLDWILFDTRENRLISELRVSGRGAPNDPKDIKMQMSASPSGPWTTVKEHTMNNDGQREKVGGLSGSTILESGVPVQLWTTGTRCPALCALRMPVL